MASRFYKSCHNKSYSEFAFGEVEFTLSLYSLRFIKVILLFIKNLVFLKRTFAVNGNVPGKCMDEVSGDEYILIKNEELLNINIIEVID